MMHGGMLCDGPVEFGRRYNRKWLLTAYEAGDVVLHDAYMVSVYYNPILNLLVFGSEAN